MQLNQKLRRRPSHRHAGFTLLEIMLVVSIIVLLLGAAINQFGGNLGMARETRVRADIQGIATQLMTYQASNGFYPTTEQGLKALVTRPETSPRPRQWHHSMDSVPLDPWQNEYKYTCPGTHNPNSYDLFSAGADRQEGTADDLGNWEKADSK
jgi:general secretion pathway protein G